MDSKAFADLKPTAQVLLLLIARQSTKDNNGHLQATFSRCKRYGIGSEHTLKSSIAQLISHGFIYRTRSHGANGIWATYALTWLPIIKKEGLYLAGYVPYAWRDWQPEEKKTTPQKIQGATSIKCSFSGEVSAESAGTPPPKSAEYESVLPCSSEITVAKKKKRARRGALEGTAVHSEYKANSVEPSPPIQIGSANESTSDAWATPTELPSTAGEYPPFELTFSD
jgi:hypothetical protein